MGLTIHYELALPGAISGDEARAKVESLRQRCLDLPFRHVGPLVDLEGEACDYRLNPDEDLRWFLVQGGRNQDGSVARRTVGFSTDPGEGCEQANFGLKLFDGSPAWSWRSFCKTQYANDPRCGGPGNFLRCHLLVIAALDAAKVLGFEVNVCDEGNYWEKRDVEALARAIGSWDAMMAGFHGALKDALGDQFASAMDGRPDTERLEAKGRTKTMDELARLIRETGGRGKGLK